MELALEVLLTTAGF